MALDNRLFLKGALFLLAPLDFITASKDGGLKLHKLDLTWKEEED